MERVIVACGSLCRGDDFPGVPYRRNLVNFYEENPFTHARYPGTESQCYELILL
jgi:hypothetical protein